jgi:hypothetical protein
MDKTPNYRYAHECPHDAPLYALGNGEAACPNCVHVALTRDNRIPTYIKPRYVESRWEKPEEVDVAPV